mmetsp:Transcript_8697/g.19527  ORF Transcript_8697/g.19527 Transcript_8697/m.19527 type:complete len:126 (-) Transcript_8697:1833-2210(-)
MDTGEVPSAAKVKEQEIGTLRCVCIRNKHHHRVHSTPCIGLRRYRSLPNNCACNKWGNELTRKSYTQLDMLYKCIEGDTKSMTAFGCDELTMERISTVSAPARMREWWGIFVDLSENGSLIKDDL